MLHVGTIARSDPPKEPQKKNGPESGSGRVCYNDGSNKMNTRDLDKDGNRTFAFENILNTT